MTDRTTTTSTATLLGGGGGGDFCPCSNTNTTASSSFQNMILDHVGAATQQQQQQQYHRMLDEELDEPTNETWQIVFVTVTITIMFYLMITDKVYPDWVMLGGLMLFAITQIISIEDTLKGFSNEGILSVLALFVVAEGLSRTGALDYYMGKILGRPKTIASAQLRLTVPIVIISAFFNNTPIVAIMIPVVLRWSKMIGCPKQQLLMPLSYATILGGTCTLVGTSTNLVVSGLLKEDFPNEPAGNIQLFDIAVYGVPNAIIGLVYMFCFAVLILPGGINKTSGGAVKLASGEYDDLLIGARVPSWSPVAGRTVKRSGLNTSAGIYLVNVRRATTGNIHRAVSPDFVVSVGDELYFTGSVEEFSAFCEKHGLEILTTENIENSTPMSANANNDDVVSGTDGVSVTLKTIGTGDLTSCATPTSPPNNYRSNNNKGPSNTATTDVCIERLQILNRITDQIDGRTPVEPGPRPTRVIVTRDAFHTDRIILVAVDCADRAGLLSDISDALFQRGGLQIKHSEANVVEGRSLSVWRCELLNSTNPSSNGLTSEALADPYNVGTLDMVWTVVSQVLSDVVGTDSTTGATATSVPKTSGAQVVRAIVTKQSKLIGKKPTEIMVSSESMYKAAIVAYQKTNGKNADLGTPFDAGDLLVLATKDGSPLLQVPPSDFYETKKEKSSASNNRSGLSKGLSSLIVSSDNSVNNGKNTPEPSQIDSDDNDLEQQDAVTLEVWNNLRVIFDSNSTTGGNGNNDVPKGEFLTAFTIPPKSPLDGKTLTEVGYSKLPGVVLVSSERPINIDNIKDNVSATSKVSQADGGKDKPRTRFKAISPDVDALKVGDVLWFSGSAEAIADLQRINGLAFYQETTGTILQDRRLIQAVVARGSPLVGRSVIDVDFRATYGGVVLAIQRGSERVHEHPGEVKLQTGDVLLIEADTSFAKSNARNYKVFALVSEVEDSSPPRPQMFFICLILIFTAFACSSIESLDQSLFVLSSIVGIIMACLGVLTQQEARDAIQWDLFIVVAAAFGVSKAMTNSGVANGLARFLVRVGDGIGIGDAGIYGAIYLAVNLLSSILTNNAAAVLAFPIAMDAVELTGTDRLKMSFIIMLAASDYITSFGYQTNLMVYGPGEYSNMDYLKLGTPMQILLWISSTAMVSTSTPDTWFVSWIVCFTGFFVVVFVRLLYQPTRVWFHERFGTKENFDTTSTTTSPMVPSKRLKSVGEEENEDDADDNANNTSNKLNNSWHFQRGTKVQVP